MTLGQQQHLMRDGLLSSYEFARDGDGVLVSGRALKTCKNGVEAGGNLRRERRKSGFELLRLPRVVASARRSLHARLNSFRELENSGGDNQGQDPKSLRAQPQTTLVETVFIRAFHGSFKGLLQTKTACF